MRSLLKQNLDNKLWLNLHVEGLCKKTSTEIHTLARVILFINSFEKKYSHECFFRSQFSYCLLVLKCHGRSLKDKIN